MRLYTLQHHERINAAAVAAMIGAVACLIGAAVVYLANGYIDRVAGERVDALVDVERAAIAEELAEAAYLRKANFELLMVLGGYVEMAVPGKDYTSAAALSCEGGRVKVDWQLYQAGR
jgi:hypothetical protein